MHRHITFAGILLVAAFVFAVPSMADSIADFSGADYSGTLFGTHHALYSIDSHVDHDSWTIGIGREDRNHWDGREGTIDWDHHHEDGWDRDGSNHHHHRGDSGDNPVTTNAPDPSVTTPEPASLALIGIGGLALAALRRRKSA